MMAKKATWKKVKWSDLKLDAREKQINHYLESDEVKILTWHEKLLEQFRQAAQRHNEKKKKMISIRTSEYNLEQFKKVSNKLGLPYQTVINMLIGMVASGDLKLNEKKGKVSSR